MIAGRKGGVGFYIYEGKKKVINPVAVEVLKKVYVAPKQQ